MKICSRIDKNGKPLYVVLNTNLHSKYKHKSKRTIEEACDYALEVAVKDRDRYLTQVSLEIQDWVNENDHALLRECNWCFV